jgi:hypothetical protein
VVRAQAGADLATLLVSGEHLPDGRDPDRLDRDCDGDHDDEQPAGHGDERNCDEGDHGGETEAQAQRGIGTEDQRLPVARGDAQRPGHVIPSVDNTCGLLTVVCFRRSGQ